MTNVMMDINNDKQVALGNEFQQLLSGEYGFSYKMYDIITCKVVAVYKNLDYAVVSADGLKGESFVKLSEFVENYRKIDVKVGDEYQFFVVSIDKGEQAVLLSKSMVNIERSWHRLKNSMETGEAVDGVIFQKMKGGYGVDFDGVVGFLPDGQAELRATNEASIMYRVLKFKITTMDSKSSAVIVTRRDVVNSEEFESKKEILEGVREGLHVMGHIKNIQSYGAFIEINENVLAKAKAGQKITPEDASSVGGLAIDGLVHVSDIKWDKVNHPSEVLKIGQLVDVVVLKVDENKYRLSLGMKQKEKNPWHVIEKKYKVGDDVTGKITKIEKYGIFVEVEQTENGESIEGLVHLSEIDWSRLGCTEFLSSAKIGDKITVKISSIDIESHRISLSRKQYLSNPWEEFGETCKVGDKIKCKIINITKFGLFVSFYKNLERSIDIKDLSWCSSGSDELKKYKIGDEIEAVCLTLNIEEQKISLGVKQTTENPYEKYKDKIQEKSVVTGVVTNIDPDGVELSICNGELLTYIKRDHLSKDRSERKIDKFRIGDKIDALILKTDIESGIIESSIKKLEEERYGEMMKKYGSVTSGATLGSIIGSELSVDSKEDSNKED